MIVESKTRVTSPDDGELLAAVTAIREPLLLTYDDANATVSVVRDVTAAEVSSAAFRGILPPLFPEWLGDRRFLAVHGTRFPYVVGEMARGITSEAMVLAAGRNDILAFFGSAGLSRERVSAAIGEFTRLLDPTGHPWGVNLIHSPADPGLEDALVDLFLERGVRRVSASAFMDLQPSVVRYAASGLTRDENGLPIRRNHVFAKISRPDVARNFMAPPPAAMLADLVASGRITRAEAELAAGLPVAEDITAEADSGGHTDNRPLLALLPTLFAVRDELATTYEFPVEVRVGAAGGLGTPAAVAAAFAAGAAYVVTGSVNQATIESGLSVRARRMLDDVALTDTAMAACADMFEMGVQVQVLRKGTLFAMRANKLHKLYRTYDTIEAIPKAERERIERQIFRASLDDVWAETRRYFAANDPSELARAERDAHHRMALVFRWYLGLSSRWPLIDAPERADDYQIWCGPAMGAFNAWVAGTPLADPDRSVVDIALNLLEGAAIATRAHQLRAFGVHVPALAFNIPPRRLR